MIDTAATWALLVLLGTCYVVAKVLRRVGGRSQRERSTRFPDLPQVDDKVIKQIWRGRK